jgi:microcystin-dependent protein
MPSTTTTNMGLVVPTVGSEPGPTWASDLNADLGILDQHNHSSGQGVQINPNGLNINADLPLNSNNLTTIKTANFAALGSPLAGASPNLGCVYVAGNELIYNDEAGNIVPITNNGSVNAGAGSITGLPSGTASASYSGAGQTFTWQSATSTPANMDAGSFVFRNITANSKGLTLNPPNAMGADYSAVLPPANSSGSTVFLTYDTSNNIGLGPSVVTVSPSGSIIMYGGAAAPSGYLLCDGSAVSRSTYSALFSAIGSAYGIGDGSTTFNIPDFRGIFPRGVDNGAGNDPDASSRTAVNSGNSGDAVGSAQAGQIGAHTHTQIVGVTPDASGTVVLVSRDAFKSVSNISTVGGSQTNPINLYVNFIIKT